MTDYPVLDRAPDVAQAVVPHVLDADGVAQPQSAGSPGAVAGPGNLRAAATPTVTSGSAYASGNAVGALLTFAGMARVAAQGGVLQTAIIRDKAGQNVPYDLLLFDAAPTAPTDKTAVALSDADLAKCIGVVPFAGIVLGAASSKGVLTAPGLGLAYKLGAGTSLYGILVTRGTPTFASTSDISVELIALPD
ncbi:MAG: hypothetical protein KIT25_06445 [Enhydrobacter sp.]|nr:MAG: hypothetical protein KIT25_06445 [Enhydrobacter sp.]